VSLQITHEVRFAQPNCFLAISSQSPWLRFSRFYAQLQLPTPELDPILFLCSQAHILAGWGLDTQLILTIIFIFYNLSARTMQKTQSLYCWEGVFTAPLHRIGSYSIVTCVFVAAGTCLPSRFLAMDVSSDITIPAFRRHVTLWLILYFYYSEINHDHYKTAGWNKSVTSNYVRNRSELIPKYELHPPYGPGYVTHFVATVWKRKPV
jgi:hypothetical protein